MRFAVAVLLVSLSACSRELPAPVAKVEVIPPAPTIQPPVPQAAPKEVSEAASPIDPTNHCTRARLPEDVLCKCLDEATGYPAASCEVKPVGGGFGILTRDGEIMIVHDDHGMLVLGALYDPGMDSFEITGTHVITPAGKPVLWVDAIDEWNEGNKTKRVYLCPVREPGASQDIPRCMKIVVEDTSQNEQEGTHEPIGPVVVTRSSIAFTPKGEVVVSPVGKPNGRRKALLGKVE